MKKLFAFIGAVLLLTAVALPVAAEDEDYTGPTRIVEESTHVIEDEFMVGKGWVACYVTVPLGFEGSVFVDFKSTAWFGKTYTVEVSAFDYYIGGQWIPEGDYTVERIYDRDGMILGDWTLYGTDEQPETITVTHDGYATLKINCISNPDYVAPEWTGGTVVTEATVPEETEAPVTELPVPEATTQATIEAPTEAPTEAPAKAETENLLLSFCVTVGFVVLVVLGTWVYMDSRKNRKD